MQVIAKKGKPCPMEGQPKKYIGDSKMVEVPESAYYRRLVRDGSLDTPDTIKARKEAEATAAEDAKRAKAVQKSGGSK